MEDVQKKGVKTISDDNLAKLIGRKFFDTTAGKTIAQKIKVKPHVRLVISPLVVNETSLFDPNCSSIEIMTSPETVLRQGCPVQYFDELEIADDVSDEDRQKIERMVVSVQPELDQIAT